MNVKKKMCTRKRLNFWIKWTEAGSQIASPFYYLCDPSQVTKFSVSLYSHRHNRE